MQIKAGCSYLGSNSKYPDTYFTFYILKEVPDKEGRRFYIGVKVRNRTILVTEYSLFWFNERGHTDWHLDLEPTEDTYCDYRLYAKSRAKAPVIASDDMNPYE